MKKRLRSGGLFPSHRLTTVIGVLLVLIGLFHGTTSTSCDEDCTPEDIFVFNQTNCMTIHGKLEVGPTATESQLALLKSVTEVKGQVVIQGFQGKVKLDFLSNLRIINSTSATEPALHIENNKEATGMNLNSLQKIMSPNTNAVFFRGNGFHCNPEEIQTLGTALGQNSHYDVGCDEFSNSGIQNPPPAVSTEAPSAIKMNPHNFSENDAFNIYTNGVDKQLLREIKASAAADFRRSNNVRQNRKPSQLSNVKLPYQEGNHIFHEVGPRLRSSSDSTSSSDSSSNVPVVFKTAMCANYASGRCRFGERCWYAHGSQELRAKEEPLTMDAVDTVYYKNMPNYLGGDFDATLAQKQWMKMSYNGGRHDWDRRDRRREPTPPPHLVTRFARDSVAAQLRAGVEARLLEDEQSPAKFTAVDRIKAGAQIRSESPMPFTLEEKPPRKISDEATSILASLTFLQPKEEKCDAGVCDIYLASGFCPLGEDCLLKHTPHDA